MSCKHGLEGHLDLVEAEVTKRGHLLSSCCQITFSHGICSAADIQLPLPAVSNDISVERTEDWQYEHRQRQIQY